MAPMPNTARSTITHCGQFSERIATRSPALSPSLSRPARKRRVAAEASAHDKLLHPPLRFSLRKGLSAYLAQLCSKACAIDDAEIISVPPAPAFLPHLLAGNIQDTKAAAT